MTWTTIHTVVRRGGEKNLTNRVCTAAEIGLGPGMLAFVQDAPAVGKSLVLDGCAQLSHPGYLAHMDPASAEVRSRIDLACCVIGDAIQHSDQHICYDVVVDVTQ